MHQIAGSIIVLSGAVVYASAALSKSNPKANEELGLMLIGLGLLYIVITAIALAWKARRNA